VMGEQVMGEQVMGEQVMGEQVMGEQVMGEQVMGEQVMAGRVRAVLLLVWLRRLGAALGACVLVVLAPQSAWAATVGVDQLGPLLGPVAGSLKVALLGVGGVAIGIGVSVWAMKKCWLLFKGLLDNGAVREATWGIPNDSGSMAWVQSGRDWSGQSAEYDAEMNSTGPDYLDYEADTAQKDAAAVSYLDRYR